MVLEKQKPYMLLGGPQMTNNFDCVKPNFLLYEENTKIRFDDLALREAEWKDGKGWVGIGRGVSVRIFGYYYYYYYFCLRVL